MFNISHLFLGIGNGANTRILVRKNYDHKRTLENVDKNIKTIKAMTDVSVANQFIQKKVFNLI